MTDDEMLAKVKVLNTLLAAGKSKAHYLEVGFAGYRKYKNIFQLSRL